MSATSTSDRNVLHRADITELPGNVHLAVMGLMRNFRSRVSTSEANFLPRRRVYFKDEPGRRSEATLKTRGAVP
jgi:hypothetical protein